MKENLKETLKEMFNYKHIGLYFSSGIGFAVLFLGSIPLPENSINLFDVLLKSNKPILIGGLIFGWFFSALVIRHKIITFKLLNTHLPILIIIFVLMYSLSYIIYGIIPL